MLAVATGCTTAVVDRTQSSDYALQRNPHAEVIGSAESVRVSLLGFSQNAGTQSAAPGLADALGNQLAGGLSQSNNLQMIERKDIPGLESEILQAEVEGLGQLRSNVIDYALVGSLDAVGFESERVQLDDGRYFYQNKGSVSGTLLLYVINPDEPPTIANSFSFADYVLDSSDTRKYSDRKLIADAGARAIKETARKIADYLRPPGQVIGAETDGRNYYVRISLGSNVGVTPNTEVRFYSHMENVNQLTGERGVERVELPIKGRVTGSIQANTALVKVSAKEINSLRIGDICLVREREDFLKKLIRIDVM